MEVLLEPYGVQFNWDIKLKMMGKKENEAGKMLIGTRYYYYCWRQWQPRAEMLPGTTISLILCSLPNILVNVGCLAIGGPYYGKSRNGH